VGTARLRRRLGAHCSALGVLGLVGVVAAYFFYPVATTRIDAFLYGHGDSYQTTNALGTLMAGGVFGAGPGEGVMKFRLPEPHTDYIFSVIGEEFGAIALLRGGADLSSQSSRA